MMEMDYRGDGRLAETCHICCDAFDDLEGTPCCGGTICGECVSRICDTARQQFRCPFCCAKDDAFYAFAARLGADLEKTKLKETWSSDLAVAPSGASSLSEPLMEDLPP